MKHDVAIIGAGMVGTTLAVALYRVGFDVALVEAGQPVHYDPKDDYDLRVTPLDTAVVRYRGGGGFSGVFLYAGDGSVVGKTSLRFELFHLRTGQIVFGPVTVPVTAHGPPGFDEESWKPGPATR